MLVAVGDDIGRHLGAQPGHVPEQRRRSGVDIDSNIVDDRLDYGIQGLRQQFLVHVVLVETHTDRFGIDLDQFGQRILQAPGDAHRTTHRNIHIRQLLPGQLGGRIDRGAGLADHGILDGRMLTD